MGRIFKIGLGLLLVGIGVIAVFGALSQDSVFGAFSEDFVYHEFTYDATQFNAVATDLDNRQVYVLPSEDDQIKVVYYDSEDRLIEISDNGDTLNIDSEKIPWYENIALGFNFNFNTVYYKVYVYLPDLEEYDLNIHSSNGKISIQDLDALGNVTVSTSNGDIILANLTVDNFVGTSSNGDLNFSDVISGQKIMADTSNGRIDFNNLVGSELDASTSNGRIEANRLDFSDIELSSSNGRVDVTVIGAADNFRIRLRTSNGSKTLDGIKVAQEDFNTSLDNAIYLHTSNGDVDLEFVE